MTVTDWWASYFARRTVLCLTSAPNSTRNYRIFRLRSRRWKKSRKSSMIPEANLWCVMMDAVSLVQRESVFFWTSLPIRHARNSLVIGKCLTSSHTCLLWVRLSFSRVYTTFLGYTHRHESWSIFWGLDESQHEDWRSCQRSTIPICILLFRTEFVVLFFWHRTAITP